MLVDEEAGENGLGSQRDSACIPVVLPSEGI